MNFRRTYAGAVDQHLAGIFPLGGGYMPQAVIFPLDTGDLRIQVEFSTVQGSMIRQGEGHFIGAGQAAGGGVQGAEHFRVGVGLHGQHLIPLKDAQIRHTVCLALLQQRFQCVTVFLRKAQYQGAGATIRNPQLLGKGGIHPCTFHIQLGLQCSGMRIKPGMNDAAVGFAGTLGHITASIDHGQAALVAAEHSCKGTACDTCTNDEFIRIQREFLPCCREARRCLPVSIAHFLVKWKKNARKYAKGFVF